LGPRLKDKQQRAKELEEKRKAEGSPKKTASKKIINKKRKATEESEDDMPSKSKKRKTITSKTIKAGVKKAVATVYGKRTTKTTAKAKTNVKLPTVKTTGRVKATVRASKATKAVPASPAKNTTSQLKRPSAETKKKILAAASKGSGVPPRKPVARKAPTKSPAKAKMPASKIKTTAKNSLGKGVKSAAQRVVRSIKGVKK